tara:strand:+ start:2470 stop:2688 length:219 start_codon:yes stop_codon:yes gene_type:complete
MKTIKLTDDQIDVIVYALEYMGTEWSATARQFKNPNSEESVYMEDWQKKEIRKQVRVARNIMPKLGYSKNNF